MNLLNKIELEIVKIEKTVMLISAIIMLISTFLQVFFRFVLKIPVSWTLEIAIMAFIIMIFHGAAFAVYHDQHLGVKNVVNKLSLKQYIFFWYLKKIIIILFIVIVILTGSYKLVIEGLNQNYTITKIPLFYIFIQIPLFGFFSVFHLIMSLIKKEYYNELSTKKGEI
jgi:TRAP-type C4-dicarboxylate transport system permease small subunit